MAVNYFVAESTGGWSGISMGTGRNSHHGQNLKEVVVVLLAEEVLDGGWPGQDCVGLVAN